MSKKEFVDKLKLTKEERMRQNNIVGFVHCRQCMAEQGSALDVGWTKEGVQVWCRRCDINVMHMDFQGQKHPAV